MSENRESSSKNDCMEFTACGLKEERVEKKKSGEFELNQPNIKYSNSQRFFPTYQSESEGSLTQRGAERVAHSINEAYYDESYLSLFPVLMKMKVMRCSLYRISINGWNHLAASPPLLSPQRLWFPSSEEAHRGRSSVEKSARVIESLKSKSR